MQANTVKQPPSNHLPKPNQMDSPDPTLQSEQGISSTSTTAASEPDVVNQPDGASGPPPPPPPSGNEYHGPHTSQERRAFHMVRTQLTPGKRIFKPSSSSAGSQPRLSTSTSTDTSHDHNDQDRGHPSHRDEDEDENEDRENANESYDQRRRQPNVIYLRLTTHEKTQLENKIFYWGYRGGGKEEAEELSQNPTPFVEDIALSLFRRWSFSNAVYRALDSVLNPGMNLLDEPPSGIGSYQRGQNSADDDAQSTTINEWDVVSSAPSPFSTIGAGDETLRVFRKLLDKRDESPLQQLPGDSRKRRVEALVGDDINKTFFEELATPVTDEGLSKARDYVVAPCPEELPIWRLLAYQAWRNSKIWMSWPGVHWAASFASNDWEVEYPYTESWDPDWPKDSDSEFSEDEEDEGGDEMSSSSGSKENPNLAADEDDEVQDAGVTLPTDSIQSDSDTRPEGDKASSGTCAESDSDTVSSISSSFYSRRWRMREKIDAEFDAADVWDVWILCQMVRCQEAIWSFDQCPGTEHSFYLFEQLPLFKEAWAKREIGPKYEECGYLQRVLQESGDSDSESTKEWEEKYLSTMRTQWPLPLPRDFIEFADYREYRFYEIDDEDVISSLLESAGLLHKPESVDQDSQGEAKNTVPDMEWDLIYLNPTRRDPLRQDSDREHLHHTLYTSDDYIQWEYDKGVDHPGLCHPCDCPRLSPTQLEESNKQDEEEHQKIVEEGEQWTKRDVAPRAGPPDYKYYAWQSRERRARLKIEMREKHGRWREYPEEHYVYGHAGGNVVFNRRRVEDVPEFVKGLARFWVDWNDCMLIMGGREDEGGDPTDEDTIYLLETLPGIKSRWQKMKRP